MRTLFWGFDLSVFSFLSQGISVPNFVQIGVSALELELYTHTRAHIHTRTFVRTPAFEFHKGL